MTTEDWLEIFLAAALVSVAVLGVGKMLPGPDRVMRAVISAVVAGTAMYLLNLAFK